MASGAAVLSPLSASAAAALIGTYTRASLWFLAFVTLGWLLGFEAIHGHPTPFYARIAPVLGRGSGSIAANIVSLMWIALAVAVLAAGLAAARRFYLQPDSTGTGAKLSASRLAGLVLFAAAFPAAVAMIRGGPEALSHAYSRQAYEYIGDIGSGGSIRGLFHDYEKIHPYLSMHAKVHPPGPIAILWIMSFVAGRTPMGLSIATILFGAVSVVPMYYWAVDVLGARRGLLATLLYTLVPTIVLFTATSADITFMPITLMTLFLFWRAIHGARIIEADAHRHCEEQSDEAISSSRTALFAQSTAYALGAGVCYGLLGLISFSLLSIGVFFALVGVWRLADERYRWKVVQTAALMLAAALGVHLLVYLWSGYNSIDAFLLAKQQFDTDQANLNALDPRFSAIWWKFLNPLCWFFFAGIPVSVLFLSGFKDAQARRNALLWIAGLSLVAFDALYLGRGEGERSAMYIMPFVVLPAATRLDEIAGADGSWRPISATLWFLGLQSIATESVLYTYW